MTKLTENSIEIALIDQLIGLGYTYFNATDIAPYSDHPQRENFASAILESHFKKFLIQTRDTLLPKLMRGEIRVNGFKN